MSMTLEAARGNIGELVRIHSRDSGRPHMGKLVGVVGKDIAVVQPGGHKRTEYVTLSKVSEWKKGRAISELHRPKAGPTARQLVNKNELLAMARPGERLSISLVYQWRHQGFIPDRAVVKATGRGTDSYDVQILREVGFFERVAPRQVKRKAIAPAPKPAPAAAPPVAPVLVQPPAVVTAPAIASDALDVLACMEAAIKAELDAELLLLEAKQRTARLRAQYELAKLREQ